MLCLEPFDLICGSISYCAVTNGFSGGAQYTGVQGKLWNSFRNSLKGKEYVYPRGIKMCFFIQSQFSKELYVLSQGDVSPSETCPLLKTLETALQFIKNPRIGTCLKQAEKIKDSYCLEKEIQVSSRSCSSWNLLKIPGSQALSTI